MRRRQSEPTVADQLSRATEQLRIYDGIAIALSRPHDLCDAVFEAADPEEARTRIRETFGFDELQATAALDAQFRRLNVRDRANMLDDQKRLQNLVGDLRRELGDA